MKISCFDYDGCLDELRRLIIEGKSDFEFDSNIWTDRSYENRANRVKGLKDCIRWTMSIMSKEPTDIKDLIKLTKKGLKNSFLIRLDENNVNPIEFLRKIWDILQSIRNADSLACFSSRQNKAFDESLAALNENGSAFEFLEALQDAEKERRADEGNSRSLTLIKELLKIEINQHLRTISNNTGVQHEKIKKGIEIIQDNHEEFIVEGDLKWDGKYIAGGSRPSVFNDLEISPNVYKSLIAFHLMKKTCEIFPGEKMILIEYWDDKYIEPVFDFFSQNQDLILPNVTMSFKECMPLLVLECDKKQKQFTTLSAPFNSSKKRKIEESRVSPSTVTRTIYSPDLPLGESHLSTSTIESPDLAMQESYSSTSTLRDTTDSPGLMGIF